MDHILNEVNRALEKLYKGTIENLRNGADQETELKQLINAYNQEWRTRAGEYARRQEERRKNEREEFQYKFQEMERELTKTRNENNALRHKHDAHLHAIKKMMSTHLMFSKIQGEKLIDLCARFCCVLESLVDHHEDVEVAKALEDEVNQEVAKILRQKSADMANAEKEEITKYLDQNLRVSNFPNACGNLVELDRQILHLKGVLHDICSLLNTLTPEYWNQENADSIGELKSQLTESTGKVLGLLETAEANHKTALDQKFTLQICH